MQPGADAVQPVSGAIPRYKWVEAFRTQTRVIGAVILRDMRTRFGRTYLAYMIAILWPLSHLMALLGIYTVTVKLAPVGSNLTVFIASGILPYILCIYPSRQLMFALLQNQPLLNFPIVKTTDLMFARAILEVINAGIVVAFFALLLYIMDIDFMPLDPFVAIAAICASVALGVGMGLANIIGFALFKTGWNLASVVMMIIMYSTSGTLWLPSSMSETARDILWWNPLLHCVEWLRSAYYDGYGENMLSKTYVISVAVLNIFLGILGDRVLRGRLQQP